MCVCLSVNCVVLRGDGAHGNRLLFLDDVFVSYLLAFFKRTILSLRTIENFSASLQTQRHLSVQKICRSTLSDFNLLFEPYSPRADLRRVAIAVVSSADVPACATLREPECRCLIRTVAVYRTFFAATAHIACALSANNQRNSRLSRAALRALIRLFLAARGDTRVAARTSESYHAATRVERVKLYLYYRAFSSFALLYAHYHLKNCKPVAAAHFVVRYPPAVTSVPELVYANAQTISDYYRPQRIVSYRVRRFFSSKPSRHKLRYLTLREVFV